MCNHIRRVQYEGETQKDGKPVEQQLARFAEVQIIVSVLLCRLLCARRQGLSSWPGPLFGLFYQLLPSQTGNDNAASCERHQEGNKENKGIGIVCDIEYPLARDTEIVVEDGPECILLALNTSSVKAKYSDEHVSRCVRDDVEFVSVVKLSWEDSPCVTWCEASR